MNRINSIALVLITLSISACGGGSSGSGESTSDVQLEGTTLDLKVEPLKNFKFSWSAVDEVDHYKLLGNPDGLSGFSAIGENIPATSLSYVHQVALYDHFNASYIMRTCFDATDNLCNDSNVISVASNMVDAIGYFKASNTDNTDHFGTSLSLSGDGTTLAIAANRESSSSTQINGDQVNNDSLRAGAVYVFVRSGLNWVQQAYIKPFNTDSEDLFGSSVDLSYNGDKLVVGAPRESSSEPGVDGLGIDNSAFLSGAAYVFTRTDEHWSHDAYLKADIVEPNDQFGAQVSVSDDGNTLAVSAIVDREGTNHHTGAVYIFSHLNNAWTQQEYLKPTHGDFTDIFGSSLALSGDGHTLAVAAIQEDSAAIGIDGDETDNSANNSGAVYLFVKEGSDWNQQAYIKASNTDVEDYFGDSLALSQDGDHLAVGASGESSPAIGVNGDQGNNIATNGSGAVYMFTREQSNWSQQAYIKASNTDSGDNLGTVSLSDDGTVLAVGAHREGSNATGINDNENDNTLLLSGAAYLFHYSDGNWSQKAYLKAPNTHEDSHFGDALSISGDGKTLAIGAYNENSAATGIGGNQDDTTASGAGAVYLY